MLTKITLALALAVAVITAVPASVGSPFGQFNPNLDCSPYRGASFPGPADFARSPGRTHEG